jgi:hypothetical protein
MQELRNKIATIAVDYLFGDELYKGDTVEILDERVEEFFLGTRRVIKVKPLNRSGAAEKEIFESEVAFVRDKEA